MFRRAYRYAVAGLCGGVIGTAALLGGGALPSDGLMFDVAARMRAGVNPLLHPDPDAAVALVLLDDRTLSAEEFAPLPRTFLAPYWAMLLDSLRRAEVRAVGFDLIFEYSPNLFRADFDQPFLAALDQHKDTIVLGRSAQTSVAMPYHFAIGAMMDESALGLLEMTPDSDGVFRRLVSHFADDDGVDHPTLVAATLSRAGLPPMPEQVLAAPRGPLELSLPAYSLVDVLRCAASPEVLRRAFAGKVVLVGSALPEEDRKPAADRWFEVPAERVATRLPPKDEECELHQAGVSNPASSTVPGVFVHALVADATIRGTVVREFPVIATAGVAAVLAGLAALLGFALTPWTALAVVAGAGGLLFAADIGLLTWHFWMPPSFALAGGIASVAVAYAVRYVFVERRRLQVQHAFSHYLSPMIVERLAGGHELRLGGETREVTVMFADLSGFTALSGLVGPEELMGLTNRYLAHIVSSVEATGGYVDKFIGDAVMAMWGAPASDAEHAVNAVTAALKAAETIAAARLADASSGVHGFSVKIGLCSGPATVGNVGTPQRFNYTAVGETVNVASRMEGLSGQYGCRIVIAEPTAQVVREAFLLCELDWVRVKGKSAPVTIYEPMAPLATADVAVRDYAAAYETALRAYRARDFASARGIWLDLAYPLDAGTAGPTPAQLMAARALDYIAEPPPPEWDGVWTAPKK